MSSPGLRVMFFFDGFNVYHSLEAAARVAAAVPVKWLDLTALATAHLYTLSPAARLAGVHYFTAYAEQFALTKPDRLARHRAYVRALTATGVRVHFGHFKPKNVWVESLNAYARIWQEKATDVHIVSQVFAHAARNEFDAAVIASGDADYAPAVPVFQDLFPGKQLIFGFPFDRKNKELSRLRPESFTFSRESYTQHQFPEAVRLPSGKFVVCPLVWRQPPAGPLANPPQS